MRLHICAIAMKRNPKNSQFRRAFMRARKAISGRLMDLRKGAFMTATASSYKIGMLVEHPSRPQWGPGKVVAMGEGRNAVYLASRGWGLRGRV